MKLSQFQFNLPADKIASEPPRWRDECKLMVLHKSTGEIEHRLFKDIIDYFGKGDTFVLNDTKVFPARLYGNIGVTTSQQMLQSELDVARWNVYEQIADLFVDEFCIMIYV